MGFGESLNGSVSYFPFYSKQLLSELRRISFLPNGVMRFDDPEINTYRGDWPMIQGAIVGGCHPGIAVVRDGIKLRKIRIRLAAIALFVC